MGEMVRGGVPQGGHSRAQAGRGGGGGRRCADPSLRATEAQPPSPGHCNPIVKLVPIRGMEQRQWNDGLAAYAFALHVAVVGAVFFGCVSQPASGA